MTTVLIGRGKAQLPESEKLPENEVPAQKAPSAGEKSAFEKPVVRQFTAPERVKRRLPLRAVFLVQLLISAAAGAFVYLSGVFGSEELRAAVAEAVRGALNV